MVEGLHVCPNFYKVSGLSKILQGFVGACGYRRGVAAKKSCNFNGGERLTIKFELKICDCKMRGVAWHFDFFMSPAKNEEVGLSRVVYSLKPALFAYFV